MAVTSRGSGPLPRLRDVQARASAPDRHVWLSASAGTGKTQVLAARVFRLLLRGVDPGAILCLTFTKAGAAEMAARINERLAAWVRMPDPDLTRDLDALGERPLPELRARARTLFARVLDAPGGGVRIATIHGFCSSLLAAFPLEAGLTPGFRALEPREEASLAREALAAMLAEAEGEGRLGPEAAIGALSRRLGEGGAEGFLAACAKTGDALEALPAAIGPWLRRALDLPPGTAEEALAQGCAGIDADPIRRLAAANRAWATATGHGHAAVLEGWLDAAAAERAGQLAGVMATVRTGTGAPRKHAAKLIAADPDYPDLAEALGGECARHLSVAARIGHADLLAGALTVGRDYARAYLAAKRRAGAVDFDDLIRTVVRLLAQPGIGEWVRFKLDQVTEHVLIDEAQDTNASQWAIVRALADEFFVGRGIYAPRTRTLFTVGDFKQAIFGFQGTDPMTFEAAGGFFAGRAGEVWGDDDLPEDERGLPFDRLSLTHSFRSTRPILTFVDAALAAVPDPGLGAIGPLDAHASEVAGPGTVELWPPVVAGGDDPGEEGWVDEPVREVATRIARAVRAWLMPPEQGGLVLAKEGRPLRPEDVMILVKRRGDLASLLVARLYAEGVPVAGVDRLRLNAPLGVQDLLAAIRFALQPGDDLSLASLLVSPLLGWSQEELMHAAPRGRGSLWAHLQATQPGERLEPLRAMLRRADLTTPYQFLEELLSGPLDGRRNLLRRLGAEARDPIEELLTAALGFETATTPSLQRFLDWFDRGDVEIVRDPSVPQDAVRVMTAHGAKGLQAPLVILADACADPTASPRSTLRWRPEPDALPIPIIRPRAEERGGPLDAVAAETEQRELEEHWRLFYVAATRAEERLVIAGSLGSRAAGEPPVQSWYAAAARAMDALGVAEGPGVRVYSEAGLPRRDAVVTRPRAAPVPVEPVPLPGWAREPAPQEARPPRPLAPSSLGVDEVADPPPSQAMRAAAERGRLVHSLFERLPAMPAGEGRAGMADRWLARAGGVADPAERRAIAASVLAVLDDPALADLFDGDALAEAPITATLPDGTVVSGTVDRLLVERDRVRIVDYKTGRVPAGGLAGVPPYHRRQMAAYAAALAAIFPGRRIEAALLYTAGPLLVALPADLLAADKPGLAGTEQS